ncbi:MAG: hypothetical protein A2603_17325 [Bdellovibrionales bacterium RIFOXYD1_FULL_55_31]|nr:MAG: hypothetical protein A2603_17325 [Bdellovibrionales bacterium RIFOXYD1_FULL_55_31]
MKKRGFSLVEMTVVLALGAIGMLGVTQFMNSSARAQKATMVNVEFISLVSSIQSVLANTTLCRQAFYDSSGSALTLATTAGAITNVNEIKAQNASIAKLNESMNSFKISKLALKTNSAVGTGLYTADLEMEVTKTSPVPGLSGTKTQIFPNLTLGVDSANKITSCAADKVISASNINNYMTNKANFTYTYNGTKKPLLIVMEVLLRGSNNCTSGIEAKWYGPGSVQVRDWTVLAAVDLYDSLGSHGLFPNNVFLLTIPFIDGSNSIAFRKTGCANISDINIISVLDQ